MDFTPVIVAAADVALGRWELVEWHYPDIIEFSETQVQLVLEMSLPPCATDASACFADVSPDTRCFMGTLFVRYPGLRLHGRGRGGHIRVVRCAFTADAADAIMGTGEKPVIPLAQSLLDIRSVFLRQLMRQAHRELASPTSCSDEALDAILRVVAVELRRIFLTRIEAGAVGRLAAWQYHRIRLRLATGHSLPTTAELAELCGISARHLHRRFHALTGYTIAKYVENFWVDRARTLLSQTVQPVQEVAFTCGFIHANSFSRAFARATGVSPLQFRQSYSKGSAHDRAATIPKRRAITNFKDS